MEVTGLETFRVDGGFKNWLFVRVDTSEGVSGWGEAYSLADRLDSNLEILVNSIGQHLVGWSPFDTKRYTRIIYRDFAIKRGSMDLYSALSGVEQALWDIVGKSLGTPVYNLLGGKFRKKIRCYTHLYGQTWEERIECANRLIKRGWTALKFDPFPGSWRPFISRKQRIGAVENLRAVREAVGPDIDLLIEAHRRLAPMHAIKVSRMMEKFDPFWFEEPCPPESIDAIAEVKAKTNVPIVTGEALYTKSGFREVFEKRAADIINPDVCNTGGIMELKEIAAMAEPYLIAVSPHNPNSATVATAAAIQVSACIPNFLILEMISPESPSWDTCNEIAVDPSFTKVRNGYIKLPTSPGLGIEMDAEGIFRHPPRSSGRH